MQSNQIQFNFFSLHTFANFTAKNSIDNIYEEQKSFKLHTMILDLCVYMDIKWLIYVCIITSSCTYTI